MRAEPTLNGPGDLQRCDLIDEEARELREAVAGQDLVAVADALGDLVYCVYGAALHFGIDLDAVVAEIHRSNMTKTPAGPAKAVKGPGYSAPRLESILARSPGAAKRCADQQP